MNRPGVELIAVADARPLRQRILRPGLPEAQSVYPDDEADTSVHVGIRVDGTLVSVSSFFVESTPGSERAAVRIRGMATLPEFRGRGYGRDLVEFGLSHTPLQDYAEAWCNARLTAAGYYQKLGFRPVGEQFELPGIGPHVVMVRAIHSSR